MFYLDTNTCIYFLNGRFESVRTNLLARKPEEIRIPAVVKAELLTGAYKSQRKEKTLKQLECFLKPFVVEDFTEEMTYTYAEIRSELEHSGTLIGANDLLIAAHVLTKGGVLVTNNTKEFQRVAGLQLINWTNMV